jgi:hypothetical protein
MFKYRRSMTIATVISISIIAPVTLLFENCSNKKFEIKQPELSQEIQTASEVAASQIHSEQTSDILKVSVSNLPQPMTKETSVNLIFSVEPESLTKRVTCTLDKNPEVDCTSEFSMATLDEGYHELKIQAVDYINKVVIKTISWTIDKSPPQITIHQSPPNPINTKLDSSIIFSVLDSLSGVNSIQCSLDSADFVDCVSPLEVKNVSSGARTLSIRATDNNGNQITHSPITWTVNSDFSAVKLTEMPPPLTNAKTARFSYIGVDRLGGSLTSFNCGLDTNNLVPCNSETMVFESLSPGTHSFSVYAISSNSPSSSLLTYVWTIDLEGPAITNILGPSNCLLGSCNNVLSFVVSDTKSEIVSIKCALNNSEPKDCRSPYTFDLPGDATGNQIMTISTSNRAGNTSRATYQWTVSYASARIKNFLSDKVYLLKGGSTTLSWECENAVAATLNGVVVPTAGSLAINPSQTTDYTLNAAGKMGAPVTRILTVTVTGPPESIIADNWNSTYRAFPGSEFTLRALVKNSLGQGVPGVPVTWSLGEGGGSLQKCTLTDTDYSGISTCIVTVRGTPGTNTFSAAVRQVAIPVTFSVSVEFPQKLAINPVVGHIRYSEDQTPPKVYPGTSVLFKGFAYNASGVPISGVPLTWTDNGTPVCSRSNVSSGSELTSAECPINLNEFGKHDVILSWGTLSSKSTLLTTIPSALKVQPDNYVHYPNSEILISVDPVTSSGDTIFGVPIEWAATSGGTIKSTCISGIGRYSCRVKFGAAVGQNIFTVTSGGQLATTLTKVVDRPVSLTALDYFGTSHRVASTSSIVVKAQNSAGIEVQGVPVSIGLSGGTTMVYCTQPYLTATSSCSIQYGNTPGTNTISISFPDGGLSYKLDTLLTP